MYGVYSCLYDVVVSWHDWLKATREWQAVMTKHLTLTSKLLSQNGFTTGPSVAVKQDYSVVTISLIPRPPFQPGNESGRQCDCVCSLGSELIVW